jgi:alanine racemase
MNSRAELVIDLTAVTGNYRRIAGFTAPCIPLPVVKADAYCLGAKRIGRALSDAGAPLLLVATLEEALELREAGLPVQIVGGILPHEIRTAVEAGVVCPVNDLQLARLISAEAEALGRKACIDIQIDTGMGRDGIRCAEADAVIRAIRKLPGLDCRGIYSHFPGALPEFKEYTHAQIASFKALLARVEPGFQFMHFGGSDGIGNFPEIHQAPFTHCRTGLALYGLGSSAKILGLTPAVSLRATLAQVRELPGGANVGYNFTHCLGGDCRVGTVALGYADGLPLALSNRGEVVIRGRRCRILGRISMDYVNVDLSGLPEAAPGDEVICLGDGIAVDDWAAAKGTHPHEILCSLGRRLSRRYLT